MIIETVDWTVKSAWEIQINVQSSAVYMDTTSIQF